MTRKGKKDCVRHQLRHEFTPALTGLGSPSFWNEFTPALTGLGSPGFLRADLELKRCSVVCRFPLTPTPSPHEYGGRGGDHRKGTIFSAFLTSVNANAS